MQRTLLWQHTVMMTVSFLAGVVFYRLFTMEQASAVIALLDGRILYDTRPTISATIIPLAIFIAVVVLFATHPYFFMFAKIVIALKMCFVGFSSVFLLAQQDELIAYGVWWFPFQVLYVVCTAIVCERLIKHRHMKKKGKWVGKWLLMFLFCIALLTVAEIFVISTIFK